MIVLAFQNSMIIVLMLTIIFIILIYLTTKIHKIMPTLQELINQVDDLQVALDNEQNEIAEAIGKLSATIAELQELVEEGGTKEQRQLLADKLVALKQDLVSTITTESGEEEEEEEEENGDDENGEEGDGEEVEEPVA